MESWKFNRDVIRLERNDIFYFESVRRKITVYTKFGAYRIHTTLDREESALGGSGFLRTHQEYLVNVVHSLVLEGNCLVLQSGKRIPVSRRRQRMVCEQMRSCRNPEMPVKRF